MDKQLELIKAKTYVLGNRIFKQVDAPFTVDERTAKVLLSRKDTEGINFFREFVAEEDISEDELTAVMAGEELGAGSEEEELKDDPNLATNFSAKEAILKIEGLETAEDIEAFVDGETRTTVTGAADARMIELSDVGGDADGPDAGDEEDATDTDKTGGVTFVPKGDGEDAGEEDEPSVSV